MPGSLTGQSETPSVSSYIPYSRQPPRHVGFELRQEALVRRRVLPDNQAAGGHFRWRHLKKNGEDSDWIRRCLCLRFRSCQTALGSYFYLYAFRSFSLWTIIGLALHLKKSRIQGGGCHGFSERIGGGVVGCGGHWCRLSCCARVKDCVRLCESICTVFVVHGLKKSWYWVVKNVFSWTCYLLRS